MRDDAGDVRAFHNVCRHRGTLLCRADAGHVRAIVCPYHSWTYSRQGELVNCHGMHDGVDKSKLGLQPLATEVVRGPDLRLAGRDAAGVRTAARGVRAAPRDRRASSARRSPR